MKTSKILFLIILIACVSFKSSNNDVTITETNYGLYKAVETGQVDNKKSATGKTKVAENMGFYETTANIPLKKGIRFGAEFIVNGKADQEVEIQVVWTYP